VDLVVENANTPFTRACTDGETLSIPMKHTTGRFWAPESALDEMEANGQVVFRYANGNAPNGAARAIAGVASAQKNVLGLMPHPEHAVDPLTGSTDGGKLWQSLVEHVEELAAA
jgi:phosphoribosylformylglycinamidine synthase